MDKLEIVVRAMDDKLAADIVAIDMQLASPMFDTFVIASADNPRLMNAIKDNIEDEMEKNGYTVKHIEGNRESRWILMDYGDIVVHLFIPEERELYHLEKLWGDQHRIDISSYLTNP